MLPNKLKITASEEMGSDDFSHVARHMPCLPVVNLPLNYYSKIVIINLKGVIVCL